MFKYPVTTYPDRSTHFSVFFMKPFFNADEELLNLHKKKREIRHWSYFKSNAKRTKMYFLIPYIEKIVSIY